MPAYKIMTHFTPNTKTRAAKSVRSWWMFMAAGILSLAAGIAVFCFPEGSYMALSLSIGILMLIIGVTELVAAVSSRNWFMTRSYNIIGGVLDTITGLILCIWPSVTMAVLPVFLGLWLMYHSFMIIHFSTDMRIFGIPGAFWTSIGGILLLLFSIPVIFRPFSIGSRVIIVLAGTGLLILGTVLIAGSLKIRKLHLYIEELKEESSTIEEQ